MESYLLTMRIVAISDVHGKWNKLTIPECDILISAGDYSFRGERHMVKDFHRWLNEQPANHIISVQGNHETWVEQNFLEAKTLAEENCPAVYFMDEGLVEIEGLKIWCSAITPFFCNWAWNRLPHQIIYNWEKIPEDTDILITHGPPKGILDELVYVNGAPKGEHAGCPYLLRKIELIKPDIHIFGHIHCGHGEFHKDGTSFYNAAICDEMYSPTNPVTVIDYEV